MQDGRLELVEAVVKSESKRLPCKRAFDCISRGDDEIKKQGEEEIYLLPVENQFSRFIRVFAIPALFAKMGGNAISSRSKKPAF